MSSKKRKKVRHVAKSGPVWHQSAEEATLARMPKYNGHACGTGVHGDVKYNRARQKQALRKEIQQEGPRTRGVLPLWRSFKSPLVRLHCYRGSNRPSRR